MVITKGGGMNNRQATKITMRDVNRASNSRNPKIVSFILNQHTLMLLRLKDKPLTK